MVEFGSNMFSGFKMLTFSRITELSRLYLMYRDCEFVRIFMKEIPLAHSMVSVCEKNPGNHFDCIELYADGLTLSFNDEGRMRLVFKSETSIDFLYRISVRLLRGFPDANEIECRGDAALVRRTAELYRQAEVSMYFGYMFFLEMIPQFESLCNIADGEKTLFPEETHSTNTYRLIKCYRMILESELKFNAVISLRRISEFRHGTCEFKRNILRSLLDLSGINYDVFSYERLGASSYYFDVDDFGVSVGNNQLYSLRFVRKSLTFVDSLYRACVLGIESSVGDNTFSESIRSDVFVQRVHELSRLNIHFGFRFFIENSACIDWERDIIWEDVGTWGTWCLEIGISQPLVEHFKEMVQFILGNEL